jgi:phosphatidate cytidylyltransferase
MAVAETLPAKKSDLGVRTASAVVMVAVAGAALWLGGLVWSLFAVAIMLGVLWEWRCLAAAITTGAAKRGLWNAAGIAYVGFAAWVLIALRMRPDGLFGVLQVVSAVIATDIGAYFAGRTIGGPKIAPSISPSKTWAGLIGGMIAAGAVFVAWAIYIQAQTQASLIQLDAPAVSVDAGVDLWPIAVGGALVAVIAQTGDFFESWLKRRAGVKDSSHLIPGHGGLFDRLDGLLAVCFVLGILLLSSGGFEGIS